MKVLKRIGIIALGLIILLSAILLWPISDPEANFMNEHLDRIETLIAKRDRKNTEVSQVDVAWHLDHILKIILNIYDAIKASNPDDYKSSFDITRSAVFLMDDFPRGVAQAPESVRPPEIILTEDIISQLEKAREKLIQVDQFDENANFQHPVFGMLNRNEAVRFIRIHTDHHFKIIDDILVDDKAQ